MVGSTQPPAVAPREPSAAIATTLSIPWPVRALLLAALLVPIFATAVRIRLFAVINYGRIIHEFDPWFNYRAAEYMVAHGYDAFQAWYDDKVWYPLGRHVGSTTYPGLQLTAYAIHTALHWAQIPVSVKDVCVFIPAAFGGVTSLFCGGLAHEATGSLAASVAAAGLMAVLPAHLMRSVAGGFDNESIAIAALCGCFYLWVRSLRSASSWPAAVLCGVAYAYMVSAWGGYILVVNVIGIHAAALVLLGRFSTKLWRAYSIWFLLGTAGALLGPARYLVGWQPVQSLEQLGPLGVFVALQACQLAASVSLRLRHTAEQAAAFRLRMLVVGGVGGALVAALVLPADFVGPLSARVRSLFIPHTKTGNPLVDSVAEHQATPASVYWHYFHFTCLIAPLGWGTLWLPHGERTDAKWFVLVTSLVCVYFSSKMIRLVVMLSPMAAVCGGALLGALFDQTCIAMLTDPDASAAAAAADREAMMSERAAAAAAAALKAKQRAHSARGRSAAAPREEELLPPPPEPGDEDLVEELTWAWQESVKTRRFAGCCVLSLVLSYAGLRFVPHAWKLAQNLSEPQLLYRGLTADGELVQVGDLVEAYEWLRENTPEDARVMAWWDYGYQLNGIANRTTIADGNTWNHEHIALLGKCLVSAEEPSHAIVRHLADYVLLWTTRYAGMPGDDIAKSPHMARIAGSVYADIDPKAFYLDPATGVPSQMMRESILWRMHHHRFDPRAKPLTLFEEAYTTTNRMVRVFKVLDVDAESKAWRAAKGVECSRQECYPDALKPVLEQRNAFKQIHGFGNKAAEAPSKR